MARTSMWLAFLLSLSVFAHGAPLLDGLLDLDVNLDLPWPFFPCCTSTTTITLGGTYTITSTTTVSSATSVVTVTAPPSVSITKVTTTVYSPTAVSCIKTGTTFAPYLDPLGTLSPRVAAPEPTAAATIPTDCPTVPPITIIPPSVSDSPCTRVIEDFSITTSTKTVTNDYVSTTTTTPTTTITQTETWVQPTPTAFTGINYYQYLNGYNYNTNSNGMGGGGFDTANWNGNRSYYTSGLTRNIDFASPNWPSGAAVCQLPGQARATDCTQWTVVFQGFLYALHAGKYTVHAPSPSESANWQDNSGFWWGGQKAYSSYANSNVDGGQSARAVAGITNSFTYTLAAGEFYPMTFIYSNGQGPAANRIDITSPDGTKYPANLNLFVPPCSDSPFVP